VLQANNIAPPLSFVHGRFFTGDLVLHFRLIAVSLLLLVPCAARGAVVAVTGTRDAVIDARGMTLGSNVAQYGTAINGESFETSAITFAGSYEYTAYWVKDVSTYHVAIARRQDSGSTPGAWQVVDLPNSQFTNGMSGGTPSDAHNVVSLGIDPNDGTIHLAYDMHDAPLKYVESSTGAATGSTWSASLFGSQTSSLGGNNLSSASLTYPMFVPTPSGNMQLFIRTGASGGGSWQLYNYNGATQTWDAGHQIDNGFAGSYQGNTQRNAYPNGFSYDSQGRLIESFVWRETASSSNHDINYVYSTDGGATWLNNAGLTVSSTTGNPSLTFSLTSAGLAVVSISPNNSLMNQQTQASDIEGNFHAIDYSLDPSKAPAPSGTWDPVHCTYYHYWRDSLGDWHRDKIPGSISTIYSTRPKIYFDGAENAIAVYGTNNGPGGSLVIAEASRASNWTDWQIVDTTSGTAGGYLSEVQADASQLASKNILTVLMQDNPASSAAASAIHSLDFSLVLTPAGTTAFTAANGNWNTPGNWSGGAVPSGNTTAIINGGAAANISASVPGVSGDVAVGSSTAGTLNISAGSLGVANTITVGRDGGAVGVYNQTGGSVSSSRFVVGDFYSTTSGGGASMATVSGGILSTGELQVAVSDGTSSSGSSFVVAGSGNVTVNGDAIVADCGNTGTLSVNGGTLAVAGNVMQGLNGNNSALVKVNGGLMTVGGNSLSAALLAVTSGTLTGSAATLTVANNPGQNAMAIVSGGKVAFNNLFIGNAGNAAGMYQSGGTVSLTLAAGVNDLAIGSSDNSAGYFKLSGGNLTTNEIDVGGSAANTVGVMDVTGGTVNDAGWITIGRGSGTSSGVLNVTGGRVNFGTANAAQPLSLGWAGTGSQAVLNVGGGSGSASVVGPVNTATGYGLNMNMSTNLPPILTVANLLSGGTLTVNQVYSSHSTATSLLNFNGGTLKATTLNTGVNFLNATTGPNTIKGIYIYSGGAIIDDSGTAITIANSLLAPTGSGVFTIAVANGGSGYVGAPMVSILGGSGTGGATAVANMVDDGSGQGTYKVASITITNRGDYAAPPSTVTLSGGGATTSASGFTISTSANFGGSLTKAGSGTLTLSGTNSYSGGTTISGGTLKMANSAALGTGGLALGGGTLDLAGYSPTVASLAGSAGAVTNSGTGLATLTVRQTGSTTFGGTIGDGANNGTHQVALVLSGSGALTLSGTDTYTGITEVLSGNVIVTSPAAIKNGNNLYVGSAGLFFAPVVAEPAISAAPDAATSPVPEPGSMILLTVGAVLLATWRRQSSSL
jgi:autotransporter-associated beta strand protein